MSAFDHVFWALGRPEVHIVGLTLLFIAALSRPRVQSWIITNWRSLPRVSTPMLWAIGAVLLFTLGAFAGMFQSQIPADRTYHDTYYVIAHVHYMASLSAIFMLFAAIYQWFPKIIRRLYPQWAGKLHFWAMFIGVNLTIFPQHFLSRQGMPRRYIDYTETFAFWNAISSLGALLSFASFLFFIGIVVHSLIWGKRITQNSY